MIVRVNERDDDRQFSTNIGKVSGFYLMTTEKTKNRVRDGCSVHPLPPEQGQKFDMQLFMVLLVRFAQIDCDLDCHHFAHFTAP